MNALVQLEPVALGQPLLPEIDSARRYVAAAPAAATERAYSRGWDDFCVWCAFRQVEPLPAHPAAVAMYLSFLADRGLAVASISQRAAAIAHRHRKAGHEAPSANPVVQDTLRGIRRTIGTAPRRKSAATADRIRAMLDACSDTMIGIRGRGVGRNSRTAVISRHGPRWLEEGQNDAYRSQKTVKVDGHLGNVG
jgi:hypothetical protein